MKLKTAIVTGASGGIGSATVIDLAKEGLQVIAAMRNLEKGNRLKQELEELELSHLVKFELLDVTDELSIQSFKKKLHNYDSIDVLINNAGTYVAGFAEEVGMNKYREQFETNVFGLIAVTQAVIPFMRKQKGGKIINISSIVGVMAFPSMAAYVASKYAVEGFSESLRLELKPFDIDVVLVEPGAYNTGIVNNMFDMDTGEDSPYLSFKKKQIDDFSNMNLGNPEEVAQKISSIIKLNEPSLRYPVGKGIQEQINAKRETTWLDWEKKLIGNADK
ncbi:SDR family oxidoreductase [Chengkuizengella sp. SCS-71B]|uniref:SDR family oxidoreductase n=1 Tax=Chengkuizengella sp. SCS-71B TaxID=3115290 RepID=UPI0032C22E82